VVDSETQKPRRRHRNRAEADHLAAEYEVSGLSQAEFCIQRDLSLKALGRYVTRYRKQKTFDKEPQRFVAVEVVGSNSRGCELTVLLTGSRRIEVKRGFDVGTLRQLISVLEQG
jgi:hypothetical protein